MCVWLLLNSSQNFLWFPRKGRISWTSCVSTRCKKWPPREKSDGNLIQAGLCKNCSQILIFSAKSKGPVWFKTDSFREFSEPKTPLYLFDVDNEHKQIFAQWRGTQKILQNLCWTNRNRPMIIQIKYSRIIYKPIISSMRAWGHF